MVYEEFGPGDNDLTTQLTRIRGTNAQAIICWTVTPAGVVFLKNAQQLGLKQMLVHGFGFVADRYMQLAGDAAEGLYLTSLKFPVAEQLPDTDPDQGHHPRLQGALPRQVQRGHRRLRRPGVGRHRHGRARPSPARAAASAARSAPASRSHIREYKGVGGVFTFSPQKHWGLAKSDVVIIEWRQGKFRLVDL